MNIADYQALAMRTSQWQPTDAAYRSREHMLYGAFAVAGEAGECVDALKKTIFHGRALDAAKIGHELGDVCWGVACLCEIYNRRFEVVVERARRWMARGGCYAVDVADIATATLTLSCASGIVSGLVRDGATRIDADDSYEMERQLAGVIVPIWAIAEHVGLTLECVLDANISKLRARYPDGYSDAASQARLDEGPPTISMRASAMVEKVGVSTYPSTYPGPDESDL